MNGKSAAYRRHPEGYWAESVEFAPTLMAIPGDADNAALVISGGADDMKDEHECYDMTHADDVVRESGPTAPTLESRMGTGGNQVPLVMQEKKVYNTALTWGTVSEEPVCKTLSVQMANQTDAPLAIEQREEPLPSCIRRLTPRECERLQGFPDDWTLIPWRGKPADDCPDSPRYRAIGNSWAVPVVRWLGERMDRFLFGREAANAG